MWQFTAIVAFLALDLGVNSLAISHRGEAQIVKPSLRSKECFSGPSYWCQDLRTAKSCGAVKHCIKTVWEHQTLPEDNDDVCQICKNMVREARNTLLSNETQEELKEVFEGSCKLIPVKIVRAECLKIADEFIPELVETLASQMNPSIVCATAGLCNNAWVDQLLQEQKASQLIKDATKPASTGLSCDVCQRVAEAKLDQIHQKTQSDILDYFLEACGHADSYSDACRALVIDNFPPIYESISGLDAGSFCKLVDACDTVSKVPKVKTSPLHTKMPAKVDKSVQVGDDTECQFCEALVKHLRDIMVANTTEVEFRTVLEGLCGQTGNFKAECLSMVDQYYDVIYGFLVNELDPQAACRLMTLCPNPGVNAILGQAPIWILRPVDTLPVIPASKLQAAEKTEIVRMTKLQPARSVNEEKVFYDVLPSEKLIGQDEGNAINSNSMPIVDIVPLPEAKHVAQTMVKVQNQEACILCEYILHQLEVDLSNRTTEEEIKNAVLGICKRLPSTLGDECSNFVSLYGDAVIFVLAHELDPAKVCPMLKLCPGKLALPKAFKSKAQDSNACTLCVFAMTELDRMLEDNKTEDSIKHSMEKLCRLAPQTVRVQCEGFVDTYTDEVIEMFLADFTPDEVCAALKLCAPKGVKFGKTSNKRDLTVGEFMENVKAQRELKAKAKGEQMSVKADVQCVLCEFAMAQLDKMIIKNSTEDEIKRALEYLCDKLPSSITDQCVDFVEQYGDAIFDLLANEMSPHEVCMELQLCPNTFEVKTTKEVKPETVSTCEICEVVVAYLDKLLEDDTIEESIDILVEKVCVAVPQQSRQKCRDIIDTYGPYIISQLGLVADQREVCQALHLCQTPGKVQLLGGKHCTWGPAYWCVSAAHANSCDALEHCQTKVWKKTQP